MRVQEKAAGVLDTPATATEEQCARSVAAAEKTINDQPKAYATMQAQFALRGYALSRAYRVPDSRITYTVDRCEQRRAFSHLHDVQAFLNQVTGVAP